MNSIRRNSITIFHKEDADNSSFLTAEIKRNGDLLFSGNDCGKVALEFWGDLDYEYWLLIPSREKEKLCSAIIESLPNEMYAAKDEKSSKYIGNHEFLNLLKLVYQNNYSAFFDIERLLKSRNIKYQFSSYV